MGDKNCYKIDFQCEINQLAKVFKICCFEIGNNFFFTYPLEKANVCRYSFAKLIFEMVDKGRNYFDKACNSL